MHCLPKDYLPEACYQRLRYFFRLDDYEIACLCEFESLLEEKPFEKVTAKDMITRLHCSKNTFYSCYNNIYDMQECLYDKILGGIEGQIVFFNGKMQELSLDMIKNMLFWTEFFPQVRKYGLQFLHKDDNYHEHILTSALANGMTKEQINRLVITISGIKGAIDAWQYSKKLSQKGLEESAMYLKRATDILIRWVNNEC